MSVQTGAIPPSGPASQRLVDRAKYRYGRLTNEPNPIWIRELRQAARLARTPIILMVIAILMTLLIASIGGMVSTLSSPASTGVVIFQVFFSVAYFVVTVVGPAVAANSIASEREGRTWEAVILTGLPPGEIARGKFLAAYTAIGMYIVMLAPVGALPFLFGGVTATEVVVAFIFLFLFALLSVAFGLALSSKMASLRVAIVVTLLLAFPATIIVYLTLGLALSYGAHEAWAGVEGGLPVWLPSAYARAPFGLEYLTFLLLIPIAAVTLPAWFLYEVTVANLTSITDDRSTGLKRWFLVATPVLTLIAVSPLFPANASSRAEVAIAVLSALLLYLSFCTFLFMGDPIGPSRRVRALWDKIGAGRFLRFLGPGIIRASVLQLALGAGALFALTAISVVLIELGASPGSSGASTQTSQVIVFSAYATAFFVFIVGLGAWLRSRSGGPLTARVLLFTVLFAVTVGPWIVAAITGLLASGGDDALLVASPSPLYAYWVVSAMSRPDPGATVILGMFFALFWGAVGFILLAAAKQKCGVIIRQHEAALAQTDRLLAQEDEAAAGGAGSGADAADEKKETAAEADESADTGAKAKAEAAAGVDMAAGADTAAGADAEAAARAKRRAEEDPSATS